MDNIMLLGVSHYSGSQFTLHGFFFFFSQKKKKYIHFVENCLCALFPLNNAIHHSSLLKTYVTWSLMAFGTCHMCCSFF
jgi:hypothetical protein